MVLAESQFQLGEVVFGRGCPIEVIDVDWGSPDLEASDVESETRDGVVFGRDTTGGSTLVLELMTNGQHASEALSAWSALSSAWNDPTWRRTPRAVTPLRLRSWGGPPRVVYGRPRAWKPANTQAILSGVTAHAAEFRTADAVFYDDVEQERVLSMVVDLGGGVTYPIVYPARYAPVSTANSHALAVGGDRATWPVITIAGPITNPSIAFLSTGVRMRVVTTLSHTQTLVIDPRPWAQTVRRSDGANLRGAASPVPMSALALPSGAGTVVQFTGQDPTGTATCTIRWRDAYTTPGGAA